MTRHYRGFTRAALENGASRVLAGLHFLRAVTDGFEQGDGIGRKSARLLAPLR